MTNDLIARDFQIPESEMELAFVRSSGPGGQKVNKTSSRAQLRWNVYASSAFSAEEKEKILSALKDGIAKTGIVDMREPAFGEQFFPGGERLGPRRGIVSEGLSDQAEEYMQVLLSRAEERELLLLRGE